MKLIHTHTTTINGRSRMEHTTAQTQYNQRNTSKNIGMLMRERWASEGKFTRAKMHTTYTQAPSSVTLTKKGKTREKQGKGGGATSLIGRK